MTTLLEPCEYICEDTLTTIYKGMDQKSAIIKVLEGKRDYWKKMADSHEQDFHVEHNSMAFENYTNFHEYATRAIKIIEVESNPLAILAVAQRFDIFCDCCDPMNEVILNYEF